MIDLKKLRLYPFRTYNLAITKEDNNTNYNIVFYPENSTFEAAYPKLGIRRMFVRYGSVMTSKVPIFISTIKTIKHFRLLNLIPSRLDRSNIGNIYIDTSQFLNVFERRFRKTRLFRTPIIQRRIDEYLSGVKEQFPGRTNVLLYYVDLDNKIPDNVFQKRGWQIYYMLKNESTLFDYMLMGLQSGGRTTYYLLANKQERISDVRFFSLLRAIKNNDLSDLDVINNDKSELSDQIANKIKYTEEEENRLPSNVNGAPIANTFRVVSTTPFKSLEDKIDEKVKQSVNNYLHTVDSEKTKDALHSNAIDDTRATQIAITSTLYSLMRDKKAALAITNKIDPKRYSSVFKALKKDFVPSIIDGLEYKNESRDLLMSGVDVHTINDNNNSARVLNKRKFDFETTFEKDLFKSFKLLENQDSYPLKVESFKKEKIPVADGDLEPNRMLRYIIILKDDRNKPHEVTIDIPEIQADGTFIINGQKKYLEYQIIINPIFFIKPKEAELQTMYATVSTHHKLTKHKSYFVSQIGGYWLPTLLLLSYSSSFDTVCKMFGIDYKVNDTSIDDEKNQFELSNGKFLVMVPKNPESQLLINSLKEVKGTIPSDFIVNKDGVRELVIQYTQNRNCVSLLDTILKNIMEPIAVQVLKMKMLPFTFDTCIHYICKYMAEGKTDSRNDITKQRIRSSEIFNYQIQSMILGSYNQYKRNREHGDKDAKYYCDTRKIVNSVLVQSRLMLPLENINPYEELSCLTRITPIGPGALESKRSVARPGRSIDQSYYGNIDPMDTPENDSVGIINHLTIDAAIGNDRGTFGLHDPTKEANSSILSACTSIIPYIASCDGNRVMMGSSQTRQSLPIAGFEQPLCQTGFETIMTNLLTDSYIRKSPVNGVVIKITENVIYVQDESRRIVKIPLNPELLRSAQGKSSLNYFRPVVKINQSVSKGQIVAEGKHIDSGVISTGSNLLVALMGWKGYSFEDGYIVSDRIAKQTMSSAVYESVEVMIRPDTIIKQIVSEGAVTKKGEPLIIRSSKEIEELLDVEEDEFVEGQYMKPSPGGKVMSIEIYPNTSIKKFPQLTEQFIKFKTRYEETKGKFPEKFLVNQGGVKGPFPGIKIVFNIERFDECVVGDKLTNNHGGKGVITLIEKNENMPVTPWGERVDIILNPIAIINRMNPSSLYEMYTGLIAKTMARNLVALGTKKTPKSIRLIETVYRTMDNTKDKALSKNIIKSFLSMSDRKYADYITQLESKNYVMPIIVPQFKQPTKEMIQQALKVVGMKSKYQLYLPELKRKTEGEVAVGYMYYKKLEQQSSYKVSARSIGKYSEITSQPIAEGKKGGGQRLGEFDTWALVSHGADKVLKELLGPLSDDSISKDEILSDILQKGEAAYREPKRQSTKKLFDVYMRGMMLDVDV